MLTTMTKKVDGNIYYYAVESYSRGTKTEYKNIQEWQIFRKGIFFYYRCKTKNGDYYTAKNLITGKKEMFFSNDIVTIV